MTRTPRIMALSLMALLALSACGKKPDFVTAPQGKDQDHFPHAYPAPQPAKPAPTAHTTSSTTAPDKAE